MPQGPLSPGWPDTVPDQEWEAALPRKQWISPGKRSAPEDAEFMGWTPACNHGMEICVSSCLPQSPYLGAWMPLSPAPSPSWAPSDQRRPVGSLANVPWTDLFAQFFWVVCEKESWAAPRWHRDPSCLYCSSLMFPPPPPLANKLFPTGTGICSPSQSFATSCPQEQLLPLTPTRLEIAFLCCKFTPTPSQVTMDVDLLLISNSGFDHLW